MFIQWTLRRRTVPKNQLFFYFVVVLAFLVENIAALVKQFNGYNDWLYNGYVVIEYIMLLIFAQQSFRTKWATRSCLLALVAYLALVAGELHGGAKGVILYANSLLFAWAVLTILFTVLLVRLANTVDDRSWRDQRFWVYLSIVVFMGGGIPYIGLLNQVYAHDQRMAKDLFMIIDVLFLLRYGMTTVAGYLLPRMAQNR